MMHGTQPDSLIRSLNAHPSTPGTGQMLLKALGRSHEQGGQKSTLSQLSELSHSTWVLVDGTTNLIKGELTGKFHSDRC